MFGAMKLKYFQSFLITTKRANELMHSLVGLHGRDLEKLQPLIQIVTKSNDIDIFHRPFTKKI
jgi:hypothetical protein